MTLLRFSGVGYEGRKVTSFPGSKQLYKQTLSKDSQPMRAVGLSVIDDSQITVRMELSEVAQTQKEKHAIYLLISGYYCKVQDNQTIIHRPREEGPKKATWISQGRGSRGDFLGNLGLGKCRWQWWEHEGLVWAGWGRDEGGN